MLNAVLWCRRSDAMKLKPILLSGIGLACILISVGCTHMHRVVNTSDSALRGVSVRSGTKEFGHGYLAPKCYSTYSGSMDIRRSPPPVVCWKLTEYGEVLSQEVVLNVSPWWNEVVFELDGKTVKGAVRKKEVR